LYTNLFWNKWVYPAISKRDLEIEKENYRETVKSFYGYVKDILFKDVIPTMKRPISKGWDTVKSKIFSRKEENI